MMKELYDYLITALELNGVLKLNKDHILYYRYDLADDMDLFYHECIDEKNKIIDNLPNGFKLDNFNYNKESISFQILKQ